MRINLAVVKKFVDHGCSLKIVPARHSALTVDMPRYVSPACALSACLGVACSGRMLDMGPLAVVERVWVFVAAQWYWPFYIVDVIGLMQICYYALVEPFRALLQFDISAI
jgi:hypothetical protein